MTKLLTVLLIGIAGLGCASAQQESGNKTADKADAEKDAFVTVEDAAKSALKKGSKMPNFSLPDSSNNIVKSTELLDKSNLVVVFYRGGWCPFCNLYLKKLQNNLDEIKAAGGELVAISAENPDDSLTTEQKNSLKFYVLSDKNLDYAREMGLVYQLPEETNTKYKGSGIDIVGNTGMEKPELPISATYIVNQKDEIVYSFVEPDYKKRAEPETVIAELKKIKTPVE